MARIGVALALTLSLLSGCGSDAKGRVVFQSAPFPEIQGRTSEVTARLDIGGVRCPLTVEADTTLSGSCPDLPHGTYSYTLTYLTNTGVVLATAEGTVEIKAGNDGPLTFPPLKMDYDDDNDRCTNLREFMGPCPASFAPQATIGTGRQPQSVAVVDLDKDGKLDVVVANAADNTVWVLMGNGDGTLTASGSPVATGPRPRSAATGDLNQDGNLDVVTANETPTATIPGSVSVLFGDGSGALAPGAQRDYTVGMRPRSVAIADVNNDGKPDLAVANQGSSSVSVLLGDGAGGFGTHTEFATGTTPRSVGIGDLNGDGKPDLATANLDSHDVSVLLGDGTGLFTPGASRDFPTGTNPRSIAMADLNGDGKRDLAVVSYSSDIVSILLGAGDGTFARNDFAAGHTPIFVAVGDLNGDGKLDLAVTNEVTPVSSVSVLLGTGTGSFALQGEFPTGNQSHSVALGDLNGDGKLDLIVVNHLSDTGSILLNTTIF